MEATVRFESSKCEHIANEIRRVLIDEFELEPHRISDEAHLFQDLGLDSLDAVDLVVSLEQAFSGRIPEVEAKKLRTVADLQQLITAHMNT